MIRYSSLIVAVAGAAIVAGCESPVTHLDKDMHPSGWRDTGTPVRPVGIDRLARYYVGEDGTLWDERGRKFEETE